MLIGFFYWWLSEVPSKILYISKRTIAYEYNYFSIPQLLKTLFDYWKKDEIDTTNMALDDKLRVFAMNLVSRFIGAAVRSITIWVGLIIIALTSVGTLIGLIGFVTLPIICIYLLMSGLAGL